VKHVHEVTSLMKKRLSGIIHRERSNGGLLDVRHALDSGIGAITAWRIESDGSLTKILTVTGQGIPTLGAEGLVAR
jgi:hypothetical protein